MNLQEAIEARHSVRKYIDKPISQDIIDILQAKIEECNKSVIFTFSLLPMSQRHSRVKWLMEPSAE